VPHGREEARLMDQFVNPARCCPECSSREYIVRGRKKVTAEAGKEAASETKHMCKVCGYVGGRGWW